MFIPYGTGRNGKSTFRETIRSTMGDPRSGPRPMIAPVCFVSTGKCRPEPMTTDDGIKSGQAQRLDTAARPTISSTSSVLRYCATAEMCARCASPSPKEMFSPGIS
jgi:hypothetical protein